MKRISLILGTLAMLMIATTSCNNAGKADNTAAADSTVVAGSIVYFNFDKVLADYDMANDLRSVVETKARSIEQEINRRGTKLENDVKTFQEKLQKGLLLQSVAQSQQEKLQQQDLEFRNYAAQKQQEIAEEQQVMMNQIADAIKTYIDNYNAEKGYAMILTTQGGILPAPVVTANPALDITEELLAGLNAEYVKSKNK